MNRHIKSTWGQRKCIKCGSSFVGQWAKYCSPKCRPSGKRKYDFPTTTVHCTHCGKPFIREKWQVRDRNYCSEECRYSHKAPEKNARKRQRRREGTLLSKHQKATLRERWRRERETLHDRYVRRAYAPILGTTPSKVPQSFVDAKREQLRLHRELSRRLPSKKERQEASKRERYKPCKVCGSMFLGSQKRAQFCSTECRMEDDRIRARAYVKAEAERAGRTYLPRPKSEEERRQRRMESRKRAKKRWLAKAKSTLADSYCKRVISKRRKISMTLVTQEMIQSYRARKLDQKAKGKNDENT